MNQELILQEQALSPLLHNLNAAEQSVGRMLTIIPTLEDEHLTQIIHYSDTMERLAFLMRGAAVSELRKRITQKLFDGEEPGVKGIKKALKQMSEEVGVAVRTLERDAQIVDTFFRDEDGNLTTREDMHTLSRGHYEEALSAPDPEEAIKLANEKASGGRYSTDQMRSDVRALHSEAGTPHTADELVGVIWHRLPLTEAADTTLKRLCDRLQLQPGEVASRALSLAKDMPPDAAALIVSGETAFLVRQAMATYNEGGLSMRQFFEGEAAQETATLDDFLRMVIAVKPGVAPVSQTEQRAWATQELADHPPFQERVRAKASIEEMQREFGASQIMVRRAKQIVLKGS